MAGAAGGRGSPFHLLQPSQAADLGLLGGAPGGGPEVREEGVGSAPEGPAEGHQRQDGR